MKPRLIAIVAALTISALAAENPQHFSPKGKAPSQYTIAVQQKARATMPFADKQDFAEARKGFIAAPSYRKIMQDNGGVSWDMDKWDFLLEGKDFDSVHPSLQRQAILNMEYGLYEVTPGIYQVRGFDLANISFIKGKTGWIVMDPLTVKETARAALAFVNEKLGKRPVVAVIISHPHGDHFGGIRGVVSEEDVKSGKVPIIAPKGFLEEAISENMFAGNAMLRRKSYTYGDALPASPFGHVDCSIGKITAKGDVGILPPTKLIEQPFEELTVDGVRMVFQSTPGTEAPVEMNTWLLIRQKLLSDATRENVDSIRLAIEGRKHVTLGLFLFYAFSPLPTNNLFIGYGLTRFGWRFIAVPFFCGRLVSYAFWNVTASAAARKLNMDSYVSGSYFGVYFIVTQIFLLFLVYALIRIDWRLLAKEKKFRWRPRRNPSPGQP